jgi:uncharacterized protein YkwD
MVGPVTVPRANRPARGARCRVAGLALAALGLASCSLSPLPKSPSGPVSAVPVSQGAAQAIISDYRKAHGLSAVELDPTLERAAQQQALAMARANELSHEVAGPLPHRLAENGLDPRAAIENVSAGYSSLESAIRSWKDSPEHNKNLLFGPMRRMGIAAATAPNTRFKTFWSVIMTN